MKKVLIVLFKILFFFIIASLLLIIFSEIVVTSKSKKYLFDDPALLPDSSVVLVLGTLKNFANGGENLFFTYRMQAAKELYDTGKVRAFVVSGDNRKKGYNEPEDMRQSLIEMGIPDEIIYLDYAGFRTLDSVVRMNKIFGQSEFVIVSQKFHNQRAVYIARAHDLTAYGYNAKNVNVRYSVKTFVRERFARVKVFIDIITGKQPKFLGEPVVIE